MSEQPRYSWNQACCQSCFEFRNPGRTPNLLKDPYRESETCVYCGLVNIDGIYIRIDPKKAPHPTRLKTEC